MIRVNCLSVVALLAGSVLVACGDDDPVDPGGGDSAPAPESVEIVSAPPDTAVVGDTVVVAVEVAGSDGGGLSGVTVSWEVVAGGGSVVASTSTTADGGRAEVDWVLGAAAGEQTLRATVEGLWPVTATVTAVAGPAVSVALDADTVSFTAVGDTVVLGVDVTDAYDNPVEDAGVVWASSDTTVAAVTGAGVVTARGGGTASVVATAGDGADTATVVVVQGAATIVLSPGSVVLTGAGDTVRLSAQAKDANGHPVSHAFVHWESSDTTVATVTADGLVRARADGTATLTASMDTATATLSVPVKTGSGVARDWVGGADGEATSWEDPLNWAPAGKPNAADTVTIAASATDMPVLGADASVGSVGVESGATLSIGTHTLTATGHVLASGAIGGSGVLDLTGSGVMLQGTVPSLRVSGSVSLVGATTVNGTVSVAGGSLDWAGQPLSIQP